MLLEQIKKDLKSAMIAKESGIVSVLRMLTSAFQNEAIALGKKDEGLNEEEIIKVLKREVKKRKDSISQFESADRADLADAEKEELTILEKYLPEEMSEEEIKKIISEVLAELGEVLPSQFGQIMGTVMSKTGGNADGTVVSKLVKEALQ
jgi:uncharacterized protein YqeY